MSHGVRLNDSQSVDASRRDVAADGRIPSSNDVANAWQWWASTAATLRNWENEVASAKAHHAKAAKEEASRYAEALQTTHQFLDTLAPLFASDKRLPGG